MYHFHTYSQHIWKFIAGYLFFVLTLWDSTPCSTNMFRVRVRVQAKVEGELWYFFIVTELQNFPVKIDARKALGEHEGVAEFIVNYAIRFHLSHCNVPENLYCFCCSLLLSIGEGNSDPTSPQWGMSYIKVRDFTSCRWSVHVMSITCSIHNTSHNDTRYNTIHVWFTMCPIDVVLSC